LETAVALVVSIFIATTVEAAATGCLEGVETQRSFRTFHMPHRAAQNVANVNVKQARRRGVKTLGRKTEKNGKSGILSIVARCVVLLLIQRAV
jgi:hypothetical protein